MPAMHSANALLSTPVRSPGLQMHPTYGMLPILYHGIPMTTPPYVFDHMHSRSHSGAFSAAAYPMLSPMTHRSAYIPRDMIIPRQLPGLHRRQNATRVARSPYYQQTNSHNHVDVNRIREGTDVRTTVCDYVLYVTYKIISLTSIDHVAKYTQQSRPSHAKENRR